MLFPFLIIIIIIINVKVKASNTRFQALGPELIPGYRQSGRRWLHKSSTQRKAAITFRQACSYLPSCTASPTLDRYQVILLGDRGTYVWTTCPSCYAALPRVGFEWTHDLLIASPMLYPLRHHAIPYHTGTYSIFYNQNENVQLITCAVKYKWRQMHSNLL